MSNDKAVLDASKAHPTTVRFIEAQVGSVDWNKVIELGLNQVADEIKRNNYTREYTQSLIKQPVVSDRPRPINHLVTEAISSGIDNFEDLTKYVSEQGREISVSSPNDLQMTNRYHYHDKWLLARTNGQYRVNSRGDIYSA